MNVLNHNLLCCRSWYLIVFWILFENVMSLHRTKATFVGLFDLGRVNEWIVTEKLGSALKGKLGKLGKRGRMKLGERYSRASFHS